MQSRISELQSLKTTENKVIIQGQANSSLIGVWNVIVNYYDAKRAASASGYKGLQSAKQRIANAKKYVSMAPLSNCSDLVIRLNSVAARLEQAHVTYLSSQVERLRPYYIYSQSDYDNLALRISDEIDEYKQNARRIYGRVSNISSLESRAANYYTNASFN